MKLGLSAPDWNAVREEFPAIGRSVYLNTAGGAPLPRSVAAAGIRFYEEMRDVGDSLWPVWLERVEVARTKFARLINASDECVAFVPTTSHAMNVVAGYLKDAGVESVVSMTDGFPAITVPLAHHGFDTTLVSSAGDGTVTVDSVREALSDRPGALFVSSVEYGTGYTHDLSALRDLCEERALSFVVDASQSLGAFPFDVQELRVDFVTASTYKWLIGGYGLSVFYVAPCWIEKKPPLAGWMSVTESGDSDLLRLSLKHSASVSELGCPNFPAIFTLGAAIDFFAELGGPHVIEQRVRDLANYLTMSLASADFNIASTRDANKKSGIVLVDVPQPVKVASQLKERDIFVSAKGLGLRLSVYVYNTFEDIDRFIDVLKEVTGPNRSYSSKLPVT